MIILKYRGLVIPNQTRVIQLLKHLHSRSITREKVQGVLLMKNEK